MKDLAQFALQNARKKTRKNTFYLVNPGFRMIGHKYLVLYTFRYIKYFKLPIL